jgi:hypothetical protein
LNNPAPKCTTCGKSLTSAERVEEESVRCARLREIAQQRQALAVRIQGGIAGMLGSDTIDTVDLVAQRKSLAQLDATLKAEAEGLEGEMGHVPEDP